MGILFFFDFTYLARFVQLISAGNTDPRTAEGTDLNGVAYFSTTLADTG